jgi:hypothetical protein
MKQNDLFGDDPKAGGEEVYTGKVSAPLYQPSGKPPHILELFDPTKVRRLINEIKNSNVTNDEKLFLIEAAKRHNVFNYSKIADYYAHAKPEMQLLMERSALIIIDFEKAIQFGYVKLSQEVFNQYLEDTKDGK